MGEKKNKLTVWVLQTGEPLHSDVGNPRPMRAMNIANSLVERGHKVVLWSSGFYHQEKRQRSTKFESVKVSENLEIRLIPSPGYNRNIGPGRLWDHAIMAKNLLATLRKDSDLPDVAFIGYPPIETAAAMGNWLFNKKVHYMVDVKDQWPSIFVEAIPSSFRSLGRLILSPYFYLGKLAMQRATGIAAMSNGFIEWAVNFAGRTVNNYDKIFPLTTPIDTVSPGDFEIANLWWEELGIKNDGTARVCFIGSHSRAFDIDPVIEAARDLSANGIVCEFIICGDGPESNAWKEKAKGLSNIIFPGWIDRAKGEALGKICLAALAPYHNVDNFILNIPNKIIDSLSQGLPILSPLHGEVRQLISAHSVGLSYGEGVKCALKDCIIKLINDKGLRQELSKNGIALYNTEYEYSKVYGALVTHLESIALLGRRR